MSKAEALSRRPSGGGTPKKKKRRKKKRTFLKVFLFLCALAALGVVYGDIGTSPLYAFRETFASHHGVPGIQTSYTFGVLELDDLAVRIFDVRLGRGDQPDQRPDEQAPAAEQPVEADADPDEGQHPGAGAPGRLPGLQPVRPAC